MSGTVDVSRRSFLTAGGAFSAASLLRISAPALIAITEAACSAKEATAPFVTLGNLEAADFAAIAARIMPTTDSPGATEAGVIYFLDRALGAEMSGMLDGLRAGLAELNADDARFAELDEDRQDEKIAGIESQGFFRQVWLLTMCGFFGMSEHGGNNNNVAWDLIGFEGKHGAWQAPYGYYDAEYAKAAMENSDGE